MTSATPLTGLVPLRAGDVLGFSGRGAASDIINVMTGAVPRWGLSHVGILAPYKGELLLFESTTFNTTPCVIQKKLFSGTQAQHIEDRILSHQGRAWHYPLRLPLRQWEIDNLSDYLIRGIGVSYDMIGAIRSGGNAFSWLESKLHGENLARIFCSEWCVAAYDHIERFDTDSASKWNPNSFVRECRRRAIHLKPVRLR